MPLQFLKDGAREALAASGSGDKHSADLDGAPINRPQGTASHGFPIREANQVHTPLRHGWITWPGRIGRKELWIKSPGLDGGLTQKRQGINALWINRNDPERSLSPCFFIGRGKQFSPP